ncbi:hypothetical protein QJS83_15005 [Bdellovibrio sp. 22V]|uniref:hypothetical protein n=1 Tax=Bdellovibrio TaxID=958 RepID=UPI002543C857|nr:hypothetical protein [Bdellovibrio sp. 22V]WII71772.1 hypothetical protein QJS83_15005 [Bdellovibrio sp. 22V]
MKKLTLLSIFVVALSGCQGDDGGGVLYHQVGPLAVDCHNGKVLEETFDITTQDRKKRYSLQLVGENYTFTEKFVDCESCGAVFESGKWSMKNGVVTFGKENSIYNQGDNYYLFLSKTNEHLWVIRNKEERSMSTQEYTELCSKNASR